MCNRSFVHKIISICKESGIIYRSSYVYEGLSGFVDYGPVGLGLKNKVKASWFNYFSRPYTYKLESSIILNRKVWFASKHSKFFLDFTVDCSFSKKKFDTSKLFFFILKTCFLNVYLCSVLNKNSNKVLDYKVKVLLLKKRAFLIKKETLKFSFKKGGFFTKKTVESKDSYLLTSPLYLKTRGLINLKKTNLMFLVYTPAKGNLLKKPLFLRPETAQGSFINFLNIKGSFDAKFPFGILQEGKVFRNEIASKQFSTRIKEFSQLEMHFFTKKNDTVLFTYYKRIVTNNYRWVVSNGISKKRLFFEKISDRSKLSHYSKFCIDLMFISSMGNIELGGISVRGSFDLKQHSKYSNCTFRFFNKSNNSFYFPYVIEPSIGLDRLILAVLECSLLYKKYTGDRKGYFFNFLPKISPYGASVFPLVKSNSSIKKKSIKVFNDLVKKLNVFYSFEGSIGKRYLKSDSMGIPFSITVDSLCVSKDILTIRYRNNSRQFKISLCDVHLLLNKKLI